MRHDHANKEGPDLAIRAFVSCRPFCHPGPHCVTLSLSKGAPRLVLVAGCARGSTTDVKQYWTYVLLCRDASYHIGVTSELEIRLAKHALGLNPNAYTFRRRPVKLVYSEVSSTPDEAIFVEKRLKGWSRAKKDALVRGDWDAIRVLSRSSARADAARDRSLGTVVAHPSTSSW